MDTLVGGVTVKGISGG